MLVGQWNLALTRKQHAKWLNQHDAMLTRVMLGIGSEATQLARDNQVVKNRTGVLKGGWARHLKRYTDRLTVSVNNRIDHAFYHEVGTGLYGPKKHWIYPVRAKFLRWKDPDTGVVHFARRVRGVKPTWVGKKSTNTAYEHGRSVLLHAAEAVAKKF